MNYNLLGYSIFISIITLIIVVVGRICYRNGNIFVASLVVGHEELCVQINKILLVGYYLVNIGYATTTLASWETIISLTQLVEVISVKTATIISILAVLHYLNIIVLTTSIQKLIRSL